MKIKDIDSEAKASLELLIRQIQDCLKEPHLRTSQIEREINTILDSWIKANDLHPEHVQILGPYESSTNYDSADLNWFNITFSGTSNAQF